MSKRIRYDVLFESSTLKNLKEDVGYSDYINVSLKRGLVGWTEKDKVHIESLISKIKTQKDKDRVLYMIKNIISLAGGIALNEEGKEQLLFKLNRISGWLYFGLERLLHNLWTSTSENDRRKFIEDMKKLYSTVQKIKISPKTFTREN